MHAASRSPVVLRSLMLAVAGVLPLGLLAASAQAPPTPRQAETPPANLDTLKARDQELEALRAEQRRTLENEARLKREIESIGDDRRKFNQQIIDTASRVVGVEERIAQTQERLEPLDDREQALQAENLNQLIAKLEHVLDTASRAARAAARSSEDGKAASGRPDLAALKDPGRLSPAIAFASAKGMLPLPVNGARIKEFGAADGLGGTEKGVSIAARPGGQITAPCDGWVVYAGPFRNYGQLLILNAGGGYHVLLAGMERISVDLGQFVVTGEPVAVMGGRVLSAAALAAGSGQPVLYVEFRKDGTPVDPGPWWAANESEKVRG